MPPLLFRLLSPKPGRSTEPLVDAEGSASGVASRGAFVFAVTATGGGGTGARAASFFFFFDVAVARAARIASSVCCSQRKNVDN